MDSAALYKLTYADLQKLAKRDGIRANQRKADIIAELIKKHHPMLVPFMTTVPATSEQEAVSKKIFRRQGITALPAQMARTSPRRVYVGASGRICEEMPRKAVASNPRRSVAASASTSQHQDHRGGQRSPKYAQGHSVGQQSAQTSHKTSISESFHAPVNTGSALASSRARDKVKVVEPLAHHACAPMSTSPTKFMRNTMEMRQTASVDMHGTRKSLLAARPVAPPRSASPKVAQKVIDGTENNPSFAERVQAQSHYQADPGVLSCTLGDSLGSASTNMPRRNHHQTVEEIERFLDHIAPLADADEEAKEQVRELRVLLDRIKRRTAALLERGRRLHQLRLALEREVYTDFKGNAQRPNEARMPADRLNAHDSASTSSQGGAGRNEAHSETDEEGDMQEVEEMTSREVDRSDLPPPSARSADDSVQDLPKDKSKRPCGDADLDSSPCKRARGSQWASESV
ncbi:hypothetical protein GY45DRAFT_1368735 [Cubamyces sp. BRFM 1775]|nr:hypothetical protein GY45DRAFT_1368735 [Cubamyces sp. BRFM 1775]